MIVIITPCFNEESTITKFLERLEININKLDKKFLILVVNDGSTDATNTKLNEYSIKSSNVSLKILNLKFNVGHQGAIFQGLLFCKHLDYENIIVMDADGEDQPEAIPLLLEQEGYQIVTVKRKKRSESLFFKLSYSIYKLIFKVITKKTIDFGNFCMIDRTIVERIQHTSFIHFPAYLLKQKAKTTFIKFDRGKRIDGKSKLGLKGLLFHAFKSMIEFAEDLLLLFLRLFVVIMIIFLFVLGNILYQKFISHTAILGWFSTLAISLLILATLCIGFFILGILMLNLIHQQNNNSSKEIFIER
ncbi:MAG: glycosyltransferase [Flavobacteriales bacterium]|nr:glycosyltransferase [Flavobacteriales bacterium]